MFQWETHVSLGVLLVLIIVIIVPRSVFTNCSSIKVYKEDKRLLFNSDPWPPAEQKLEMPCDNTKSKTYVWAAGMKCSDLSTELSDLSLTVLTV